MTELLKEGHVIELNSSHTVYANIPKHFVYANCKGDFSLTKTEVSLLENDFAYFRGRYIVTGTENTGGGLGHGMHDYYPDGYLVKCISEDGKHEVSFYQTGCFTAMIENIKPVGMATKKWVIEDIEEDK